MKTTYKDKEISVHSDGKIFVNGKSAGLRQWACGNRYSDLYGAEQKDVKGKGLIEALQLRGLLPR